MSSFRLAPKSALSVLRVSAARRIYHVTAAARCSNTLVHASALPLRTSSILSLRYKSSVPADVDNSKVNTENASECPFSGAAAATTEPEHPTLVKVPTLPFFGSTLRQYSGTPVFDMTKFYDYSREMQRKFGSFFSFGFPGFGEGLHGKMYAITDPNEMLKVIRAEGSHPSGAVSQLWPLVQAFKDDNSPMYDGDDHGLLGQGERWKAQRTFLQMGMLDPRSARTYVPGIVAAAELASKGAQDAASKNKINYYLNLCSFDMFCTFMFGELTRCADQSSDARAKNKDLDHEENEQFCKAAIAAMEGMSILLISPKDNMAHRTGYKSAAYKEFYGSWTIVKTIGLKKLRGFADRYNKGELNEYEKNSYLANALARLDKEGSKVTYDEMLEMALLSLFAGVDTTSGVTAWNLVHIALNKDVQEELYAELVEAVQQTGGKITAKTLEKKSTPYLHAVLHENYRLTPPFGNITIKAASQSSIEIHGQTLPKGTVVSLENKYNDTPTLEDAMEFKPKRWLPEAVQARVGTDLELMDHALFRDSFGQGARRCPGNRVATNEVLSLLAQLVLDYEISPPAGVEKLEDIKYNMTALLTPTIPQFEFSPRNAPAEVDERAA